MLLLLYMKETAALHAQGSFDEKLVKRQTISNVYDISLILTHKANFSPKKRKEPERRQLSKLSHEADALELICYIHHSSYECILQEY